LNPSVKMSYLKLLTPTRASFKNIWYPRTLLAISIVAIAILLFAYDLIFFCTFESLGNTTSYFPWAWGVLYTGFSSVQIMFVLAVALFELLLSVAGSLLYYYTVPNLRKSFSMNASSTEAKQVEYSKRRFTDESLNE
jgi:hypothetical protein